MTTNDVFKAICRLKDESTRIYKIEDIVDPVEAQAILMAEVPNIRVGLVLIESKINAETPPIAA